MKVASRVLWDTSVFSLEYRHPLHLYAMWIGTSTEMSLELSKETIKGFALWDDDEVLPPCLLLIRLNLQCLCCRCFLAMTRSKPS